MKKNPEDTPSASLICIVLMYYTYNDLAVNAVKRASTSIFCLASTQQLIPVSYKNFRYHCNSIVIYCHLKVH